MGTPQLSYSQNPTPGLPGSPTDLCVVRDAISVWIAEATGVDPGRLVVRDADGNAVLPLGQAADPDAVIATIASSASPQTLTSGSFDGVVGASAIAVPAPVTLTLSNSADWNATNATLTAVNAEGVTATEILAIPDGGNATVTSTGTYVRVVSLAIPAQAGAGGTATLGFAASSAITSAQILGVAARDPSKEPTAKLPLYYRAGAWRKGRIWVTTEAQVAEGQRAYVRVFAGVGENLGAWRGDADGGDALPVPGARFIRVPSSTLAELEVDFAD